MPSVPFTIRLHPDEVAEVRHRAAVAGLSTSEFIRRELALRDGPDTFDLGDRVERIERRLGRLEDMAGL